MFKCLICYVPNNGLHFGINCCRPCSAFFRRSMQLKLTYKCQKQSSCNVTLKNRDSCRFCRLKKCLEVGLGQHAIPAELHVANDPRDGSIASESSSNEQMPVLSIKSRTRKFNCDVETSKKKINDVFNKKPSPSTMSSIPLGICQQALLAYEKILEKWPNCTKEKVTHSFDFDLVKHVNMGYSHLDHIAQFCMSIRQFSELPHSVKWLLFKNFWTKFYEIERTYTTCQLLGNDRTEYLYVTFEGIAVNLYKNKIPDLANLLNTSIEGMENVLGPTQTKIRQQFVDPFKAYQPDLFETIYIIMDCLWTLPDNSEVDVASKENISTVKEHLAEELYSYYLLHKQEKNYASRIYKLQSLVIAANEVAAIRKEDGYVNTMFKVFKHDFYMNGLK